MKKILIIGAGIHGCFIAKYLKKHDVQIFLVEKNKNICEGTSASTHNRANRGFHYPRSKTTAFECKNAYEYFEKNYSNLLNKRQSLYCIEKKSKVNFSKYKKFYKKLKLKYEVIKRSKFIKNKNLEAITSGEEGCYDHFKIVKLLKKEIKSKKINFFSNFEIKKIFYKDKILKLIDSQNRTLSEKFDIIINTTYSNSNEILKIFKNEKETIKYNHQITEVAVVKSNAKFPPITIMDGPFITILPYQGVKNHFLLYDVENSILSKNNKSLRIFKKTTNFKMMKKKLSKYINFVEKITYIKSLYGHRPVPIRDKYADRSTKILKSKFKNTKMFTFREGKYISAPYIADKFVKNLCKKKIIHKLKH
jgi:hypothetical protein